MLPERLVAVRSLSDTSSPYWMPSSTDGYRLRLEAGETLLFAGRGRVRQIASQSWELPSDTIINVTNRRLTFFTTQYDTGGGWGGIGDAGILIAAAANAVSKRRAAARSAGKIAIGQVRHEWVNTIAVRHRKPVFGSPDAYLTVFCPTTKGGQALEFWSPEIAKKLFARWFVKTVCTYRLELLLQDQAPVRSKLEAYIKGGQEPADADKPGDLRWILPGQTDYLIDAVRQIRG